MVTHSQQGGAATLTSVGGFLSSQPDATHASPHDLWGFGGLHGGLALAAMTNAMRATAARAAGLSPDDPPQANPQRLRSVTGRLHRAVREEFRIEAATDSATRSTTSTSARIVAAASGHDDPTQPEATPLASATALFGSDSTLDTQAILPTPPAVPTWREGTLFRPPPSLVPVSVHTELRVTGTHRPFAGGTEPRLTSWIRLTDDDLPPDDLRLLFLVDALAPSYAAILSAPTAIPTVELSVHFSGAHATTPWVLVDAHTTTTTPSGWNTETINVFGEDGTHLAEARQLRLVRQAQAS